SPTVEESPRETVDQPKRRRRLPTGPPTDGTSGLFRLAILIGAAILFAVILVLWVNSCRAGQKREEYQNYMEAVASRATQSEQVGRRLNTLLTTPGIQLGDLRSELDGLRQEQAQVVASARELKPPGPLREEQESLVEALQFRVSGLDGLAQAFGQVLQSPDADTAGRILAIPAQRLVASDVVYEDLFRAGATDVLSSEGVTGVTVPDSNFVQTAELSSPTSWGLIVDRLTQSPEAGGLHGNQISAVFVQPGDQQLSPTEDNTVKASERLSFQVQIMNSGDSQETQVQVTFTIQQSPTPIRKRATIAIINPQETKTVTFRDLGTVQFATRTTVKVNVEPVQGETNTGNNTAEYPVIFTLE
ncbi:MAG: CARDB domain-containing protein, partial [Gaiellaceae bacterium]